jgi:hypothetical protein
VVNEHLNTAANGWLLAGRSIRTYRIENDWCVADDAGWLPGIYSTEQAAIQAALSGDFTEGSA